jgi:hypothetical protein
MTCGSRAAIEDGRPRRLSTHSLQLSATGAPELMHGWLVPAPGQGTTSPRVSHASAQKRDLKDRESRSTHSAIPLLHRIGNRAGVTLEFGMSPAGGPGSPVPGEPETRLRWGSEGQLARTQIASPGKS